MYQNLDLPVHQSGAEMRKCILQIGGLQKESSHEVNLTAHRVTGKMRVNPPVSLVQIETIGGLEKDPSSAARLHRAVQQDISKTMNLIVHKALSGEVRMDPTVHQTIESEARSHCTAKKAVERGKTNPAVNEDTGNEKKAHRVAHKDVRIDENAAKILPITSRSPRQVKEH
ncbi:hypothetical protein PV11_08735 [Exophiala sideris]|uniref:Uncharacterized protein n=1 Tax=Exophiala sideris TaxID=1016849 RepID=A0A0D1WP68_9EURO|nr:hypothetical protein PV11_08735 [Exophiala sideris]